MAKNAVPADEKATDLAAKCVEIASVYELYEDAKRSRGAVDFGDLIMLPALLIERDEAVRNAVRLRRRQVLVDEYQDVNRASVRLVKAAQEPARTFGRSATLVSPFIASGARRPLTWRRSAATFPAQNLVSWA